MRPSSHRCNVRCAPPVHAEVLYSNMAGPWLRPGEIGYMLPHGRVEILTVEPAEEARPHPVGHPSYVHKRLYVFRVLPAEEDIRAGSPGDAPSALTDLHVTTGRQRLQRYSPEVKDVI